MVGFVAALITQLPVDLMGYSRMRALALVDRKELQPRRWFRLGPPRQWRPRSKQGSRMGHTHRTLRRIEFDHRHFKPALPIPHQFDHARKLRSLQSNFHGMHRIHQTGRHQLPGPDRPKFLGPLSDPPGGLSSRVGNFTGRESIEIGEGKCDRLDVEPRGAGSHHSRI